jgi:hypothetical protein
VNSRTRELIGPSPVREEVNSFLTIQIKSTVEIKKKYVQLSIHDSTTSLVPFQFLFPISSKSVHDSAGRCVMFITIFIFIIIFFSLNQYYFLHKYTFK